MVYLRILLLAAVIIFTAGAAEETVKAPAANFNDSFAERSLGNLHAAKEGQTLLVSPAATGAGLLWLANLQGGETAKEIMWVLGARDGMPDFDFSGFLQNRGAYSGVSMWIDSGYKDNFSQKNLAALKIPLSFITFAGDPSAGGEAVSKWLGASSQGAFPVLLETLRYDRVGKAMFFNALGAVVDFPKSYPVELEFSSAGKKSKTPAIATVSKGYYYQAENFSAVRLPVLDGSAKLTVILPKEGANILDILSRVSERGGWFKGWPQMVNLQIPAVEMHAVNYFKRPLQKMGVEDLFVQPLMLAGPETKHSPALGGMLQMCYLKFAASENKKPLDATQAAIEFACNRPFIVLLEDTKSGALLLAGVCRYVADMNKKAEKKTPALSKQVNPAGYGPWTLGMSRAKVKTVFEAGPYRYGNEGQLRCMHAPWKKEINKRCEFYFDGGDRLNEIRLWLYEGEDEKKAEAYAQQVQEYFEQITGKKQTDMVKTLMDSLEKQDKEKSRVAVYHAQLKGGRSYITMTRHPVFGWFVYLTFKVN